VNEGGAKGVPKLGWRSSRHAEAIELRVEDLAGRTAELMEVELQFLLSARPGQGTLVLRCSCDCIKLQSIAGRDNPFPVVQTDAWKSAVAAERANITVTAATKFVMLWKPNCTLRVAHQQAKGETAVRVDGLTYRRTSFMWFADKSLTHALKYPLGARLAHRELNASSNLAREGCAQVGNTSGYLLHFTGSA
jgi:hypothetical protein